MARIKSMGEVYSSGDVNVNFAGVNDVNPSAIEYGYEYAHEYVRGIRRNPRGWKMGAKDMNGKITLPLDFSAEIEKIAPNRDIAKIRPFPINVVFTNEENEMIVDLIIAKFKGNKRSVSKDGELENEYDLFVLDIQLNIMGV